MRYLFFIPLLSISAHLYAADDAGKSTCYGTTADGRLENGVQLPAEGTNFQSYSGLGRLLGRTYVHSTVNAIIIDSYEQLEQTAPGKLFKYAESGFAEGGQFKPHKTHRNGLSVDFIVPVVNKSGESVYLPTNPFNKLGYAIEFDGNGHFEDYTIDFDAMALHLAALEKSAKKQGVGIWRVIFDPALQPLLFQTTTGSSLKAKLQFSTKPSWVRHDEHYHVDFDVPCMTL